MIYLTTMPHKYIDIKMFSLGGGICTIWRYEDGYDQKNQEKNLMRGKIEDIFFNNLKFFLPILILIFNYKNVALLTPKDTLFFVFIVIMTSWHEEILATLQQYIKLMIFHVQEEQGLGQAGGRAYTS